MASLFTSRVFARSLLRGNCRRNIFFCIFRFDVWDTNPSFTSNKPTQGGFTGRQCVKLLDERLRFKPQFRYQNAICKNISSATSSQQISSKNSESKQKIAMKSFYKNLSFGDDLKLQVRPFTYKINAHNMSDVCSQAVILIEGL